MRPTNQNGHFQSIGSARCFLAHDGRGERDGVWAGAASMHWGAVLVATDDWGRTWDEPQEANIKFDPGQRTVAIGVWVTSYSVGGAIGPLLGGYHLLPTARAELLRRLGRSAEAAESYRRALALVSNEVERRHPERRLREVGT